MDEESDVAKDRSLPCTGERETTVSNSTRVVLGRVTSGVGRWRRGVKKGVIYETHTRKTSGKRSSDEERSNRQHHVSTVSDANDQDHCTQRKSVNGAVLDFRNVGKPRRRCKDEKTFKTQLHSMESLLTLLRLSPLRVDTEQMKPFQLLTRHLRRDVFEC